MCVCVSGFLCMSQYYYCCFFIYLFIDFCSSIFMSVCLYPQNSSSVFIFHWSVYCFFLLWFIYLLFCLVFCLSVRMSSSIPGFLALYRYFPSSLLYILYLPASCSVCFYVYSEAVIVCLFSPRLRGSASRQFLQGRLNPLSLAGSLSLCGVQNINPNTTKYEAVVVSLSDPEAGRKRTQKTVIKRN